MKNEMRHINRESAGPKKMSFGYRFDGDVLYTNDDSALFEEISSYMRARFDIEDVKNDPSINETRDSVWQMITDYKHAVSDLKRTNENSNFIKNSLSGEKNNEKIKREIKDIKLESRKSGLDLVTADWVREWHKQKQMAATANQKSREINDFITSSLDTKPLQAEEKATPVKKKGISRSLFIRYISLSAAAVIGIIIVIGSLLPSPSPEELFNSYYKPFEAISPVTRGDNTENIYFSAIEDYISGDYTKASEKFSLANANDPSSGSALFFMGLADIELGNYDKAISDLSSVVSGSGEYHREAQWYLGMTYMKRGNTQMAAECFEELAKSSQYYRERSEKILRRLK